MRILSIAWECPHGYGGLGTFVSSLLPEIAKRHSVLHLCLYDSTLEPQGNNSCLEYAHSSAVVRVCREGFVDPGGGVGVRAAVALGYRAMELVEEFDAVVGHDVHSALALYLCALHGKKCLFYVHMPTGLPLEAVPLVLKQVRVAVNSFLVKRQLESLGTRSPVVVYPAPPLQPVSEYSKKHNEEPLVLIPSRYQFNKHPKHVLPSLELLRSRGYRFRAVVMGRATSLYRPELPEWVEIVDSPSDEKRDELYRSADVVVQVGFPEPFGLVALEAIALGTPTLVSNESGVSEVLPREVVYTRESLAELLEQLLSDPGAREELWWKERMSWIMGRSWSDVWGEMEALL